MIDHCISTLFPRRNRTCLAYSQNHKRHFSELPNNADRKVYERCWNVKKVLSRIEGNFAESQNSFSSDRFYMEEKLGGAVSVGRHRAFESFLEDCDHFANLETRVNGKGVGARVGERERKGRRGQLARNSGLCTVNVLPRSKTREIVAKRVYVGTIPSNRSFFQMTEMSLGHDLGSNKLCRDVKRLRCALASPGTLFLLDAGRYCPPGCNTGGKPRGSWFARS